MAGVGKQPDTGKDISFAEREKILWAISRKYVEGEIERDERRAYELRYGHAAARSNKRKDKAQAG